MWLKPASVYLVGARILLILALCSVSISGRGQTRVLTNQWAAPLPSLSDSSPAIGLDGTLYLGTFLGEFCAFKPDGTEKWRFHAGGEIKCSPAIGPDGTIYFGSRNRKFYALYPNGKERWEFKSGAWVDSSPAVAADGTVYFGSWDKKFYALSAEGTPKWSFQTAGEIQSSPAIGSNGSIYFGSHDGKLYSLAPDGRKNWEYATGAPIISSPGVDKDGSVYFSSLDGFCYALNADGSLKWRLKTGGITESSPVIGQDGTIYVGVNNSLWAIAPNGNKRWESPVQLFIRAAPLALADNSVCFVSEDGYLINLDKSGTPRCMFQLGYGGAAPVMASNNVIYGIGSIINIGFKLHALPNGVGLAQSYWPKFRGSLQNSGRSGG